MTQAQIARKLRPAQIEIAIGEPQIFVVNSASSGNGKASARLRIPVPREQLRSRRSASLGFSVPGTRGRDLPLTWITSSLRRCMGLDFASSGIFFRAKNNLGQTFAIAQIDKNHAAMIARHMHPAGKRNFWPMSALRSSLQ